MQIIKETEFITYKNHRSDPYFTYVKNGKKTMEGRLRKDLYRNINVNDHIVIYTNDETEKIEVIVKGVRNYQSFLELLKTEELEKLLPDIHTIEDAVKVYRTFYTEDQEKEFGVVSIEVQRLNIQS